jgi:2-C-methyl-D-erythritol 4-phosphate cytidylyltransferase
MKKYAVIVAGGAGLRMGASIPKQFLPLRGKPLLWHTLTAFLTAFDDLQVILVLPESFIETGLAVVVDTPDPRRVQVTGGGSTRFHSVKKGLDLIDNDSIVFVHDGVRCLVTPGLIRNCHTAALAEGSAIPAITAMDTIRIVTAAGSEQIDRDNVRIIQTPQTFLSGIIKPAFEQAYLESFTDEASVVEASGRPIHLVEGEATNIKITRPMDLLVAEKILENRELNRDNA